jgi:hypothetical protein
MSTSAPPAPAGSPPPKGSPPQGGDQDPRNLHDLAVDAQTDIQKLAVGLAHAGAAPQAVAELTKMGQILSQVVKVLASGGEPPGAEQGGPPQPGGGPGGPPQPGGGPGGPPQPGGPPPGPPEAQAVPPVEQSIHGAAQHLHNAMIASAQQRSQQ